MAGLRIAALTGFVVAAAAALKPSRVLRPSLDVGQRSRQPCAQWAVYVDEASGETYYYNEQTRESAWELPVDGSGPRVRWELHTSSGVHSPLRRGGLAALCNGDEQILGRFDMVEQDPFISRAQCVVHVAADGSASLTSLGKPPTMVRADSDAPWYAIFKDQTEPLIDGVQICLAKYSETSRRKPAIFTCFCRAVEGDLGTGMGAGDVQYSEDGLWMWDGAEWVPALQ